MNATPVSIDGVRGGPSARTMRRDLWWVQPLVTAIALTGFVAYLTWAAFRNGNYYAGAPLGRDYLSPLYSPCLASSCPYRWGSAFGSWYTVSPALIVLIIPLGFRLTCYYYRKAYYRSFWLSPPACGVADAHRGYSGESRFPLVLQNVHRYFFYLSVALAAILTWDAIISFRFPGGAGIALGTIILVVNAALIWTYTISCHACRHLCGGQVDRFSEHPLRYRLWRLITPLNAHHMGLAWASLTWVAFTDFYIWLVASGTVHDPRLF